MPLMQQQRCQGHRQGLKHVNIFFFLASVWSKYTKDHIPVKKSFILPLGWLSRPCCRVKKIIHEMWFILRDFYQKHAQIVMVKHKVHAHAIYILIKLQKYTLIFHIEQSDMQSSGDKRWLHAYIYHRHRTVEINHSKILWLHTMLSWNPVVYIKWWLFLWTNPGQ